MRMLRRLPKILKYIPGKAQDLRAWFMVMQYWLAGSDENVEAMIRFLISRYSHVDSWQDVTYRLRLNIPTWAFITRIFLVASAPIRRISQSWKTQIYGWVIVNAFVCPEFRYCTLRLCLFAHLRRVVCGLSLLMRVVSMDVPR